MLALLMALSLLGGVLLLYVFRFNPIHPAMLWGVCWGACFSLYAVLGIPFRADELGVVLAFSAVLAFLVGAIAVDALFRDQPDQSRQVPIRRGAVATYLALTLVAGVIVVGSFGAKFGFSLDSLRSVDNYIASSGEASRSLHEGAEDALTLPEKILTGVFQSGFIVAALLLGTGWRPGLLMRMYLPAALFVATLFSAATTLRGFLAVPLVLATAAALAGMAISGRERAVISRKSVGIATLAVSGFVVLLVALQMARMGGRTTLLGTLDHLRPWFAGYIPGFANWYAEEKGGELAYGLWFFRGFLAPLGLVDGEGFTETTSQIPLGNGQTTNAMTFLRAAVADFGSLGAVAWCALMGAVSALVFRLAKGGSRLAAILLVAVYAGIAWSPNYWFFAYGARIISVGLAAIVMPLLWKPCVAIANPARQAAHA